MTSVSIRRFPALGEDIFHALKLTTSHKKIRVYPPKKKNFFLLFFQITVLAGLIFFFQTQEREGTMADYWRETKSFLTGLLWRHLIYKQHEETGEDILFQLVK